VGIWIALAVVVGLALVGAWIVDRRDRRRGHRLRRSGSMWRDEVREHRRDARADENQKSMNSDHSWMRDRRR
jgi:hypothetical protein